MDDFIKHIDDVQDDLVVSIGDLYEVYQEYSKNFQKLRTITTHRDLYNNHIAPTFADLEIKSITPKYILKWQDELKSRNLSNNYL